MMASSRVVSPRFEVKSTESWFCFVSGFTCQIPMKNDSKQSTMHVALKLMLDGVLNRAITHSFSNVCSAYSSLSACYHAFISISLLY